MFKAVLSIVFVAHIGYIVFDVICPEYPDIVNYKKSLDQIDFPLTFRICAAEANHSIDDKKYAILGYRDSWTFFYGQSWYNDSIYGWAGHTEYGTTIGSVEGLKLSHDFK